MRSSLSILSATFLVACTWGASVGFAGDNLNLAGTLSIHVPAADNGPVTFPARNGQTGWVVSLGKEALATPAYADHKVMLGGGINSTQFKAFEASTGREVWAVTTVDNGPTSAVVYRNTVIFNTESCDTEADSITDGHRLWHQTIGSTLHTAPVIVDDLVVSAHPFSFGDGKQGLRFKVIAMDAGTGNQRWDAEVTGDVLTAPVAFEHRLFFSCTDGTAFCLNGQTGGMVWMEKYRGTAAPAVDKNLTLFVAESKGQEGLLRLDTQSGEVKDDHLLATQSISTYKFQPYGSGSDIWDYQGPHPVLFNHRLFTAHGNVLRATDPATGEVIWQKTVRELGSGTQAFTPPAMGAKNMYIASTNGLLLVIDQRNGALVSSCDVHTTLAAQPILAEGNVYLSTTTGQLICLPMGADADNWYQWGGNAQHNKID